MITRSRVLFTLGFTASFSAGFLWITQIAHYSWVLFVGSLILAACATAAMRTKTDDTLDGAGG
jgi:hypothetical protein